MKNFTKLKLSQSIPCLFTFILAFNGGFADAATFLTFGVFVGHLTGNTVISLVFIVQEKYIVLLSTIMALVGFLGGTSLGILWRKNLTDKSKMYIPLIVEIILMTTVTIILALFGDVGFVKYLLLIGLSSALGLQNGVYTKAVSVGIHTTYISGGTTSMLEALFYTDKSVQAEAFKLNILLIVVVAFILGAFFGALLTYYFSIYGFVVLIFLMVLSVVICKRYWHYIYH